MTGRDENVEAIMGDRNIAPPTTVAMMPVNSLFFGIRDDMACNRMWHVIVWLFLFRAED